MPRSAIAYSGISLHARAPMRLSDLKLVHRGYVRVPLAERLAETAIKAHVRLRTTIRIKPVAASRLQRSAPQRSSPRPV